MHLELAFSLLTGASKFFLQDVARCGIEGLFLEEVVEQASLLLGCCRVVEFFLLYFVGLLTRRWCCCECGEEDRPSARLASFIQVGVPLRTVKAVNLELEAHKS